MKILKKNPVVFLMVLSQLLLVFFVLYWLKGQYRIEKHDLELELSRGFDTSEKNMVDSMLALHLINPILRDTSNLTIQLHFLGDTLTGDDNPRKTIIKSFQKGQKPDTSVLMKEDTLRMSERALLHIGQPDTANSFFLYQGVRMFVSRMEGMSKNKSGEISFFGANADTLVLKSSFTKFLKQNAYNFSVCWISSPDDIKSPSDEGITVVGRVFRNNFAARIDKYNSYLLASMSPQIFFALVLLLITAVSFRLAYLSIKKQKGLLHLKNEFISNITHELKTPVATVKVALEALLDFGMKKDPKVSQEYLEMSLMEMNRLELLVNRVLNNSVLESGKELFYPEKMDLKTLIEETVKSQQYRFDKNQATLVFITGLEKAEAKFDKIHIQGVLLNLIDNSLKYGGDAVKIEISLQSAHSNYMIRVKDNGPGIPKEFLDKVFDKFFRVPTNGRHNVKGYGLGLSYAMLVMQHHKGSITVQNLSEGGCEFILTIPLAEA